MSNMATEKMLAAVEASRERAQRAEAQFDRRNNAIQADASRSINLFGGSAVSQVADLASAARKACDALYAAYQMEIRLLDETCRPLLSQDPSLQAVREVAKLIKWLNDESEIENNFTASLNNHSLGDVASARYIPSMENKMIQSYWEGKYHSMPGSAELEYAKRRAVEQRKLSIEERRRADAAKRRQAFADAQASKNAEQRAYQVAMVKWRADMKKAEQEREQAFQQRLEVERSRLEGETRQKYDASKADHLTRKATLEQQTAELQQQLEGMGLFQLNEKMALKKQIKRLTKEIAAQEALLVRDREIFEGSMKAVEEALRNSQQQIRNVVNSRIPLPEEPCPPGMTAEQFRVRKLQNAMVNTLRKHGQLRLEQLREKCEAISGLTEQRIKALIRQEPRIHDSEIKRMTFYTADAYDPGPSRAEQLHQERRDYLLQCIRRRNPCTHDYLERETEMLLTREVLRSILEELHNEGLITRYVEGNYCYEIYD